MHEYDTTTEDAEEAIRKIRLLDHFGDLGWVTVGGEVDVDNLLEMAIQDHGLGDELDEQEDYTPEEIVDLAEENDVPLVQLMMVAGDRIDSMFIQTPSAEELGLEDTPETVITQTTREALESLSEEENEAESDSSVDQGNDTQPLTGVSEGPSEPPEEQETWEGRHRGSSRNDIEVESQAPRGSRKAETLEFLEEHRGEWVNALDYKEYGDFSDLSTDEQQRNAASAAIHRADSRWDFGVDTRKNGKFKEYRLPEEAESGSEEEETEQDRLPSEILEDDEDRDADGKTETEGIPGQVSKGTQQHEALALLTHLADRYEEPQTIHFLADTGRREKQQYSNALQSLKEKNLVTLNKKKRTGEGQPPGEWRPTQAGRAELKRTGGFQLNNDYGEE